MSKRKDTTTFDAGDQHFLPYLVYAASLLSCMIHITLMMRQSNIIIVTYLCTATIYPLDKTPTSSVSK